MKILIMGLPGTGKTTLAKELEPLLKAVWFNADEVREHISWDLGFAAEDRPKQAKRMRWMADQVSKAGYPVICDFVCPTEETRSDFDNFFGTQFEIKV